jgi:IS5 family transposase
VVPWQAPPYISRLKTQDQPNDGQSYRRARAAQPGPRQSSYSSEDSATLTSSLPGRAPVGVERMLRIYFLQQWFNLSDPAVEEALYDSVVMRRFVGIDLGCEPVPDETTGCKFRHLLEEQQLGEQILGTVNLHLQTQGVRITTGTIVDATILHAPTSTKNREQKRDPEMHQTKKGNQWYFGMKAHVGVDSKTKIIHTAVATRPT